MVKEEEERLNITGTVPFRPGTHHDFFLNR